MAWYLPPLIFCCRVLDVSVGTVRIILVMRGFKKLSMLMGFIEVNLWLFAMVAVFKSITDSIWGILAYGCGFSVGTLVGMMIEERLALGRQMVRVVVTKEERSLAAMLRQNGHRVTELTARNADGEAELVFVPVRRKHVPALTGKILEEFPGAYVSVEDLRSDTDSAVLYTSTPRQLRFPWLRLTKFK